VTQVKVINHSNNPLPAYATVGSSGLDLRANLSEALTIPALDRALIPTGIHIQLPKGYEAQVRPRSGLALKNGVFSVFGTIDQDYTGEIKVILFNSSKEDFVVEPSERIAQLVISQYQRIEWLEVAELDASERGTGGFGSTGKN